MNILYQATVTSTAGRDGRAQSNDGKLDVQLSMPKELGGNGAAGTNPEQLFAAGYSACFLSAMKFVAAQQKIALDPSSNVTAIVGILLTPRETNLTRIRAQPRRADGQEHVQLLRLGTTTILGGVTTKEWHQHTGASRWCGWFVGGGGGVSGTC